MATEQFGRYLIVHKLAVGGMGEVLLARQSGPGGFDRFVAVKRLLPHLVENKEFVEMFLDEARLAARLTHPNICQIHEFGCHEGSYYIVMEYLSGEALGAVLETVKKLKTPLAAGLAAHVLVQICEGLHYAHERTDEDGKPLGLVHRDVTPSNVFITYDGSIKLLDFGIAKAANRIAHTVTGGVKGKFGYISPEAYQGAAVDRRADIFALGVVLWELLTQKRLYKREAEYLVGKAIVEEPPPDPRTVNETIPQPLAEITLKALAKKPDERFQTALEMRRALSAFLRTEPEEIDTTVVSALMQALFGELMESRKSVLDKLREAQSGVSDMEILESTRAASPSASASASRVRGSVPPINFAQPASEFAQQVTAATAPGSAPGLGPHTPSAAFLPPPRRRTGPLVAAGGAVLLVAAAGGWALTRPKPPPPTPQPVVVTPPPQPSPPPQALPPPSPEVVAAPAPAPAAKHAAAPGKHVARKPAAGAPATSKEAFNPDKPVDPWANP